MEPDQLVGLALRPQSEFEWEDLLVRVELMPRALRVTMDEVGASREAATLLDSLLQRELVVARFLEAAADRAGVLGVRHPGESREPAPDVPISAVGDPAQGLVYQADTLEHFNSVRARSFAMMQRRGIDVWNWSGPVEDGSVATVYQVLTDLVRSDVDILAALRRTRAGSGYAC